MATFAASCNQHQYSVEEDLFVLRASGEMNADEARTLSAEMLRVARAEGRLYILVALDGFAKPAPETRRVISNSIAELPLAAMAYFGGGLVIRTVLTLVNRAAIIMRGREYPLSFFATEVEARAWLSELRGSRAESSPGA